MGKRTRKNMRPKVKVGLPSKKKKRTVPAAVVLPGGEESLEWAGNVTRLANYRNLGLAADPNRKGGRDAGDPKGQQVDLQLLLARGEGASEDDGIEDGDDAYETDDVLRAALGKKRRDGTSAPLKRLTRMQQVYVRDLVEKHGDNIQAMFKDLKLNKMQHSIATLKNLCLRYHTFLEDDHVVAKAGS